MKVTTKPNATAEERRLVNLAKNIAQDYKSAEPGSRYAAYLLRRSILVTELLGYEPIS